MNVGIPVAADETTAVATITNAVTDMKIAGAEMTVSAGTIVATTHEIRTVIIAATAVVVAGQTGNTAVEMLIT